MQEDSSDDSWDEDEVSREEELTEEDLLRQKLREELAGVSFDKLLEIRQEMGTKEFERVMNSTGPNKASAGNAVQTEQKDSAKAIPVRKSKSAPLELSAKKQVSRKRHVVDTINMSSGKRVRDPRFDENSGTFNPDLFKRSYGFVREIRKEELSNLDERIKKTKDESERAKLEKLRQRITSRQETINRQDQQAQIKREWKKQEDAKVSQGKKRFHLKQCKCT